MTPLRAFPRHDPQAELMLQTMALKLDQLSTDNARLMAKLEQRREVVRPMRLSPQTTVAMPSAESVGYFSGDLPSITVHLSGRVYTLELGQSLPLHGKPFHVGNPFFRTGEADILINAPVTGLSTPRSSAYDTQTQFVTYDRSVFLDGAGTRDRHGVAIMLTRGRAILDVTCSQQMFVSVYPDAPENWRTSKPAGMMEGDPFTFQHTSGDVRPHVETMLGEYNNSDRNAWEIATGRNDENTVRLLEFGKSFRYILETNSAIFLNANQTTSADVHMKMRCLGNGERRGDV